MKPKHAAIMAITRRKKNNANPITKHSTTTTGATNLFIVNYERREKEIKILV